MQGLFVPFACVGSGDPVRVLRLYTMNTLDIFEAFIAEAMYNLPLPVLMCYAQALCSETSYCYCYCCVSVHATDSRTLTLALYCAVPYILLVETLVERYFGTVHPKIKTFWSIKLQVNLISHS